jgi:hypothetical protein
MRKVPKQMARDQENVVVVEKQQMKGQKNSASQGLKVFLCLLFYYSFFLIHPPPSFSFLLRNTQCGPSSFSLIKH